MLLALLVALAFPVQGAVPGDLAGKVWNHGAKDCATNRDPAIEVWRFDDNTFVLRQNKCLNFEAPFIYVFVGEHTAFVQDTGATADPARFPLYETVSDLVRRNDRPLKLLVTHSHGHRDHTAADAQFRGKPGVTLIEPGARAVRDYFGLATWPQGSARIDLGGRVLEVVPAPGHQDAAIAVFDAQTGWLLTGDTLYPGRLYVKNWDEYRSSIRRLVEFSRAHPISAVLGTHVEMSRTGTLFDAGSTFQPGEASLALGVEDLLELDRVLGEAGDEPHEIATTKFAVVPLSAFQRLLGRVLGWFVAD